jgi:hypothetical protein
VDSERKISVPFTRLYMRIERSYDGAGLPYRTLLASIRGSTPTGAPGVGRPNSAEFCFHFVSVSRNPEIYSNSILFKFECHVKSENMFKFEFVQIRICSDSNLFKLEFVQIQICSNSNLFRFKFVQTRICSNSNLFKLEFVQIKTVPEFEKKLKNKEK